MNIPLEALHRFLEEDAPYGDITSEALLAGIWCAAAVFSRQEGVIAGVEEATALLTSLGLSVQKLRVDGSRVEKGTRVLEVRGEAQKVLLAERTILNIMGRMSGIATRTRLLVDRVQAINPRCRIASTRKTAPGLRVLDKKAVMIGGGDSHRFSLSDLILIKDNHLALVPLEEAIKRARERSPYHLLEVEVTTPTMAEEAARKKVSIIMLDNLSAEKVAETLDLLDRKGLRKGLIIEVSGGITEDNLDSYAPLDIDIISMGSLTHSVIALDLSLEILEEETKAV